MLDRLIEVLPQPEPVDEVPDDEEPEEERVFSVALVGRPNVGKSTLFNRLIGEDRAVVHDLPGTTRDTVDTIVETDEGPIRFVDTAGMRRKAKIDEATEYYSLVRALQAVDKADVALLIIDSTVGVTAQDQRLAERIDAAGSPVVVLLNKHELLTDAEARADLDYQVKERLRFIGEAPVLKISALTGQGRGQAHAGALDEHRGLPPAGPDAPGERGHPGGPAGPAGSARREGALRHAGRHGSADLHPVRQPRGACHLPPLPRAQPPGGLRPGRHADQDAGAEALLADAASGGTGASSQDRAIAVSRSAKRSSSSSVVM